MYLLRSPSGTIVSIPFPPHLGFGTIYISFHHIKFMFILILTKIILVKVKSVIKNIRKKESKKSKRESGLLM